MTYVNDFLIFQFMYHDGMIPLGLKLLKSSVFLIELLFFAFNEWLLLINLLDCSVPAEFLAFYGLFNLYLYTMAYMYSPLPSYSAGTFYTLRTHLPPSHFC